MLEKPPMTERVIQLEKQYIADKLRIKLDELEEYFNMPLSSYRDYDNDEWLYKFGSKVLKFLERSRRENLIELLIMDKYSILY